MIHFINASEYDLRKGHEFIIKVMENITKNKNIFLLIYGYGEKNSVKLLVTKSWLILKKYPFK